MSKTERRGRVTGPPHARRFGRPCDVAAVRFDVGFRSQYRLFGLLLFTYGALAHAAIFRVLVITVLRAPWNRADLDSPAPNIAYPLIGGLLTVCLLRRTLCEAWARGGVGGQGVVLLRASLFGALATFLAFEGLAVLVGGYLIWRSSSSCPWPGLAEVVGLLFICGVEILPLSVLSLPLGLVQGFIAGAVVVFARRSGKGKPCQVERGDRPACT